MTKIIAIASVFLLASCANGLKQKEKYKILFGKRCTENNQQYSYVWFHTVEGDETVRKEWCK